MRRPQFSLRGSLLLMALLAAFPAIAVHFWPRIQVRVENSGDRPVRQIALRVTGNAYELGDLAPGEFKEVVVKPTGESSLQIEFEDEAGAKIQSDANEYIEPGYDVCIVVSIRNGLVDARRTRVRH